MKRERWLILTFVPALILFNAFVVLNYTGLSYKPFSWQASAVMMAYPDGDPCTVGTDCLSDICAQMVCCGQSISSRVRIKLDFLTIRSLSSWGSRSQGRRS